MRPLGALQVTASHFMDLVFPRSCLGCYVPVENEDPCQYLCSSCVTKIPWTPRSCCVRCGHPFWGMVSSEKACADCVVSDPAFGRGKVAFQLLGVGQAIVHALKYKGIFGVANDVSILLGRAPGYLSFFEDAILVPVPLHAYRRRVRGYNQASLIAHALTRSVTGAECADLLTRIRPTPTQTCLPRDRRLKNVKNAFATKPESVIDGSRRYVVIDDVVTTGATLDACSRVLRKAGAGCVEMATLARG